MTAETIWDFPLWVIAVFLPILFGAAVGAVVLIVGICLTSDWVVANNRRYGITLAALCSILICFVIYGFLE